MVLVAIVVIDQSVRVYRATKNRPGMKAMTTEPTQDFEYQGAPEGVWVLHSQCGSQPAFSNQGSIIRWRGEANPGASPVDVLRATKDQLEREQKTKLGSDSTARAMVLVMQAIAELEGKQTEMPDGTPIIQ